MPLIKSKSKEAFGKNVATEIKAGKPRNQAVAIAYATKNAAPKKNGGAVESLKKAGFYEEGKSKSDRLKIVSDATTKPERIQIVEKVFSNKKMKSGGKVGLWDNIHAKRERIKAGSGERMRKPGSEGAPTKADFKAAAGKMAKGGEPRLSVSRGEKLPTEQGAGLTAKGRAKYNNATGSNLKAPAPNPKTKADADRKKSFCARMSGMPGPAKDEKGRPTRKAASLKRWNCPGW